MTHKLTIRLDDAVAQGFLRACEVYGVTATAIVQAFAEQIDHLVEAEGHWEQSVLGEYRGVIERAKLIGDERARRERLGRRLDSSDAG